jgi:diguanylate cyclase (GGDEF)-like protein
MANDGYPETRIRRFFGDKWFDEQNDVVTDAALIANLNNVLTNQFVSWLLPRSTIAYFSVPVVDAVIEVTLSAVPRQAKRSDIAKKLKRSVDDALLAFKAEHDDLTGLLKGTSFNDKLAAILRATLEGRVSSRPTQTMSEIAEPASITILALDLDHFKQINDSHGHVYGDIVLMCVAKRFGDIGATYEMERKMTPGEAILIARPSGEEFLIALLPSIGAEEAETLATEILNAIGGSTLPSDSEWDLFGKKHLIPKPAESARHLTVSIGMATDRLDAKTNTPEKTIGELRSKADTAMYRAKSGGRNTVRSFEDILERYGTILEHHVDTGIVAIDIGSQVGVTLGQEFWVYHPDFSGERTFYLNDGRTKKPLGIYPRVPSGRIQVIDVQRELSFCTISYRKSDSPFAHQSTLEAIPVGAIAHLIGPLAQSSTLRVPLLTSAERLPTIVSELVGQGVSPVACVFSIHDVESVLENKGSAYVNGVLATLHEVIRERFGTDAHVSQIQATQIAVVSPSPDDTRLVTEKIEGVLHDASRACAQQVEFTCGCFVESWFKNKVGEASMIRAEYALEYARYALASRPKAGEFDYFTNGSAAIVLLSARNSRRFQDGIKDFEKLSELGVKSANIYSLAGFCANGLQQDALPYFRNAAILLSDEPSVWFNLAWASERTDPDSAKSYFRKAVQADKSKRATSKGYIHKGYIQLARQLFREELASDRWSEIADVVAWLKIALKEAPAAEV